VKVLIAAAHMSPFGTSRHFVTTQQFGRFWGKAEMDERATQPETDVNDPKRTSAPAFAVMGRTDRASRVLV
jgi:hypothetical protein